MSRATEWLSMNSDMSMRTSASSVSNRNSASALQSSVLPTPGRAEEEKGAVGSIEVGKARPRPAYRVRDRAYRLLLPDHPLRERRLHVQ